MANGVRTRVTSCSGSASSNAVKPGNTSRTSTPSPANAGGNAAMTSPSPPVLTHGNNSAAACSARIRVNPLPLPPEPSPASGGGRIEVKPRSGGGSVLALVDESVLLDPRHHRAQPLADLLDRVLRLAPPHRLEARLPGIVLEHPFAREAPGLDFRQHLLHLGPHMLVDDAGPARIVAVLCRVRHRIAHIRDAALIDQIDDQLHLVTALEIRHLRCVARFDERLETGEDQRGEPTTQHRLLSEQIGLAFLAERRLDDAGAAAADCAGIG